MLSRRMYNEIDTGRWVFWKLFMLGVGVLIAYYVLFPLVILASLIVTSHQRTIENEAFYQSTAIVQCDARTANGVSEFRVCQDEHGRWFRFYRGTHTARVAELGYRGPPMFWW